MSDDTSRALGEKIARFALSENAKSSGKASWSGGAFVTETGDYVIRLSVSLGPEHYGVEKRITQEQAAAEIACPTVQGIEIDDLGYRVNEFLYWANAN